MTIRFDDRVAIVTGAGAGIGRVYSLALARLGASVVVNDLGGAVDDPDRPAAQVVAEIQANGGKAVANFDSVADEAGATAILRTATDSFGKLDILINNAGNLFQYPLSQMSDAHIQAQVAVHLFGAIYMTRAAIPEMQRNGYGRVVFTSSGSGLVGFENQSVYGAAKAGMVGLMNCLVIEKANKDILFNTVVPTAISKMSDGILPDHLVPFLTPENVAPATLWMSSDACDVNGAILVAGGGYFGRVALMRSTGVLLDPTQPISVDDYDAAFDGLADLSGATPYAANMLNLEDRLKEAGLL